MSPDSDRGTERSRRRGRDDAADARRRHRGRCRLSPGRGRQRRRGHRDSGIALGHLPAVHRYSDAGQHGRAEAGARGARPLARHQDHPGFRPGEAIRCGKAGRQPLLRQAARRRANDRRIAGHGGRRRAEDRSDAPVAGEAGAVNRSVATLRAGGRVVGARTTASACCWNKPASTPRPCWCRPASTPRSARPPTSCRS